MMFGANSSGAANRRGMRLYFAHTSMIGCIVAVSGRTANGSRRMLSMISWGTRVYFVRIAADALGFLFAHSAVDLSAAMNFCTVAGFASTHERFATHAVSIRRFPTLLYGAAMKRT